MADVLGRPETGSEERAAESSGGRRRAWGWRRLQVTAAGVTVLALALPMVIEGEVAGFLVAMAAPFVIGLALARFLPRAGAIFIGVIATATLGASAPFTGPALLHPEALADFVPQVLFALSLGVAAVAAIPAFREVRRAGGAARTPRVIAGAAAVVVLVAGAVSVAAAARVQTVAPQSGDETVVARDFAFAPAQIDADAGTISVHVTNQDSTRHTFTIDGLTDVSVPPNSAQRVTFEAEPGTYRFYCIPHSADMDGVLVVE